MTVSYIPQAQNYLGSKVADAIADKLGTQVSIGRVDLGLFNRVIIDDVRIKDQQQQDMLRVGRLSVRLELLPLLDGKISISSAQLFGAHLILYKENERSKTNFQFVLDSLASKDTTSHAPEIQARNHRRVQSLAPEDKRPERAHQPEGANRRLAERERKTTGVEGALRTGGEALKVPLGSRSQAVAIRESAGRTSPVAFADRHAERHLSDDRQRLAEGLVRLLWKDFEYKHNPLRASMFRSTTKGIIKPLIHRNQL